MIWKDTGWGTIIILAALASIDQPCTSRPPSTAPDRWRRMWHVTLPGDARRHDHAARPPPRRRTVRRLRAVPAPTRRRRRDARRKCSTRTSTTTASSTATGASAAAAGLVKGVVGLVLDDLRRQQGRPRLRRARGVQQMSSFGSPRAPARPARSGPPGKNRRRRSADRHGRRHHVICAVISSVRHGPLHQPGLPQGDNRGGRLRPPPHAADPGRVPHDPLRRHRLARRRSSAS